MTMLLLAADGYGGEHERLKRDLVGAENAVLSSLIVHANAKSKYLCAQAPYACAGPDRADLGLALLAASNQPEAPKRLAGLVRYKFDAGLSTDYTCYVHLRRQDISKVIKNLDARALSHQCNAEVGQFVRRAKRGLYDVAPGSICRTPDEIAGALKDLSKVLGLPPGCDGF